MHDHDEPSGLSVATMLIVLTIIVSSAFLTWAGKLDGQAFVAVVSGIIGGVLVTRGAHVGSKASVDPPPGD